MFEQSGDGKDRKKGTKIKRKEKRHTQTRLASEIRNTERLWMDWMGAVSDE